MRRLMGIRRSVRVRQAHSSPPKRRWRHGLAAAAVALAGLPLVALSVAPAHADGATTYSTPGTHTYTVPAGATGVSFTVAGSAGSEGDVPAGSYDTPGGPGAVGTGSLAVPAGTTLTVSVGGYGGTGLYHGGAGTGAVPAAYGSGLTEGSVGSLIEGNGLSGGGPGGGASAIEGYVVAGGGGGGGGGFYYPGVYSAGGAGGYDGTPGTPADSDLLACDGTYGGGGATQTAGGAGGCGDYSTGYGGGGGYGYGGNGGGYYNGVFYPNGGGGGGGGGYYGGGGGGGDLYGYGGGGGGGSSWASPAVVGLSWGGYQSGTGSVTITPTYPTTPPTVPPVTVPTVPGPVQIIPGISTPSSSCQSRGGTGESVNQEGTYNSLYAYAPWGSELDVCVRSNYDASGDGYGGEFVITPTNPVTWRSGLGTPGEDQNGGYCTTPPSGWSANQVPGTHPMASGSGSVPYVFDSYLGTNTAGTTQAWVCMQVGANGSIVDARVVVPVPSPSVSTNPGYDVTWYPDRGTP